MDFKDNLPGNTTDLERIRPIDLEHEMKKSFISLCDGGHHHPRAAGCARRPQAGAPPHPLRDARARRDAGQAVPQDARVSSATCWANIIPHGDSSVYGALVRLAQDFCDPLSARRRAGQLRLRGRRRRGGHALHRSAHVARSTLEMLADIDKETVDFSPNFDETLHAAERAAQPIPEPAGQRLHRHCGRHGDEHPAAQPRRGHRRRG